MTLDLQKKLMLGFGGLLALLLSGGMVSLYLLAQYSGTLETIFRENHDSVLYGQHMKRAVEDLDDLARAALWDSTGASPPAALPFADLFEANLRKEQGNITLPGEQEVAEELDRLWTQYRAEYEHFLTGPSPEPERQRHYREVLLPQARQLRSQAQQVIDMNLRNAVSVDGQVQESARRAKQSMYALLAIGVVLATFFVVVTSRAILQPLRTLTQSVRQIEQGNLDLVVRVHARDELGQLAEAFNSMAARLREFRRLDRAKLARLQHTTQLALDSLPDAVAIVNPEGRLELANHTAQRLFGLAQGNEIATGPTEALADLVRRAAREGRPVQPQGYGAALQVIDGQERFFLPHAVPILEADHQVVGVTLVLVDVTELRRLDEMKSGLLSVVSHELKTPLTSIRMATHLLLDECVGPLNPKQVELLLAAREDSDRLHHLIDHLLDMSRLEAGSGLLALQSTDPGPLTWQAAEAFRTAFRGKGVALESDVAADLPKILADPTRIGQVVANLLDNALRYTPRGGTVRLGARAEDGMVHFSVEDSGAGITPEHLPHVFERFFRAPGQNDRSGTGLGLALCKDIVSAHRGAIWAEPAPGGGSIFHFTLPMAGE